MSIKNAFSPLIRPALQNIRETDKRGIGASSQVERKRKAGEGEVETGDAKVAAVVGTGEVEGGGGVDQEGPQSGRRIGSV
jgi:hypothetical protein